MDRSFIAQLNNYRLTTAEIVYWMPDHRHVLQSFVWQNLDLAPKFPALEKFLDFWDRNLDGKLHRVRVANAQLIKKIAFPRALIVASSVATEGLHFLLCLPVLAIVIVITHRGAPAWPWLWGVPLLFVLQAAIIYGIALTVASCNVFFRDIERLLVLALTVLFFLTPVIYERAMVPPTFQPLLALNPFSALIVGWRTLLLHGTVDWNAVQVSAAVAIGAVAIGHAVFHRLQWKFAEAL